MTFRSEFIFEFVTLIFAKPFHGSTDQSSSEIKDQQDQTSWRSTGDQVVSDQRSKVQSSTFHRSDH